MTENKNVETILRNGDKAKKLKEQQEDKVKRSVVSGDSASELIKNIREVDWDKVAEEVRPRAGGKIDFGV